MKVLRIPAYYYPELVSSTHLGNDLDEAFTNAGITVERIVPTPTRNVDRETRKKYKKIKYEEKNNGKIIIHRFSMFGEGKNTLLRAFRYVLTNIVQYHKGKKIKNVDIIMGSTTPPTQGLFAARLAKKLSKKNKKKVPFIYSVQDVFPASLVNTGIAKKSSLAFRIGTKMSNYIYKNADAIIVISNDIKKLLISLGVEESKIHLISNWIDTSVVKYISKENNKLYDELNISRDTYKVVYAGNLGKAQGIDTLLTAASKLKDEKDIEFIIFGSGVEENKLKERAINENLNNVHFYPLQPLNRVQEVYSLGDCCAICCTKGTGDAGLPSKTWSIISCERPLLVSFDEDSELYKTVEEKQLGLCTPSGDGDALAEQILKLYHNSELGKEFGKNGRNYAVENVDKVKMTNKYISLLKSFNSN